MENKLIKINQTFKANTLQQEYKNEKKCNILLFIETFLTKAV